MCPVDEVTPNNYVEVSLLLSNVIQICIVLSILTVQNIGAAVLLAPTVSYCTDTGHTLHLHCEIRVMPTTKTTT